MTFDVKPADTWISVNRDATTYRVAAGARWRQVIGALDPVGFSPAVMPSSLAMRRPALWAPRI
jgi:FAD/FMN-containing dehydrogenase